MTATPRQGPAIRLMLVLLGAGALAGLVVASMPLARNARARARSMAVAAGLRQLGAAAEAWAAAHDGRLPPADGWVEALRACAPDIHRLVAAPGDAAAGRVVAMNRSLDGRALADVAAPGRTVLFFTVEPGSPESGGPELLPLDPRGVNLVTVVFADGHTASVPLARVAGLVW